MLFQPFLGKILLWKIKKRQKVTRLSRMAFPESNVMLISVLKLGVFSLDYEVQKVKKPLFLWSSDFDPPIPDF